MQKRSFAALTLRKRIVRNDWAKVSLRVMIAAAEEAGVLFIPIPDKKNELHLPADLSALNAKAIAMGQAVRRGKPGDTFSDEEVDLLAARYLHCSANWNAIKVDEQGEIQGGMSAVEPIGFINRPDENWQRTVYTMEGKKK